jgi:hypothetical protein
MSKQDFISYVVRHGANKEKTIETFKIVANNPDLAVGFFAVTKITDTPNYKITLKEDPIILERYRCSPDHMGYAYKCLETGLSWYTGNNNLTYGSWDCHKSLESIGLLNC